MTRSRTSSVEVISSEGNGAQREIGEDGMCVKDGRAKDAISMFLAYSGRD